MTFITFIYKIGNEPKTYYGKYCSDYISDDHEGLDREVKIVLVEGINKYRKQQNLDELTSNIYIGVLSFSSNKYIPTYSSNDEIKCFDFYCEYYNCIKNSIKYINGNMIE